MSQYVSVGLRHQVRNQFANCCAYCRTAEGLTVALFEVDHIVPRCAGGETVFENLCLACPTCNRYKTDRTVAIDPDTQEKVALFHPHRDLWTDHFSWNRDQRLDADWPSNDPRPEDEPSAVGPRASHVGSHG